jgi:translation initiation factor eIF-2B subunit epsilon
MAVNKDKSKKSGKKWGSEDIIQAVVIADSFNFRFLPLTTEKPRALLPLVNRPLIDYTVEFLAVSGVQEIFVYCCSHADVIKSHFASSRWTKPSSPIKLHTIISEDCPSVGDALRDIDSQGLVKSDFVLVSGDLVSNMELLEVIQKHKKLREADKMVVMTNVYKRAQPHHRTRSQEDDIFIVTDSKSNRILYCEKPNKAKKITIPTIIFEDNNEVDINYNILDCHISICSPTVPQLFADNFDYQTRYHFIRGIIVNEEILGNSVYAHFITDQYAARVGNLQTYEAISKDVIHRWVYPLVPDNRALEEAYSYGRNNIYLSNNVSLGFDCILEEDVVLGLGTTVGPTSHITHSSIGQSCHIGKGVEISGCFIWNNVRIGDNCKLTKSILADNVELKANVVIEAGSILSFNVVIGRNFQVACGTSLTTNTDPFIASNDDWGDENNEEKKDDVLVKREWVESEVGAGGKGYRWETPQPDEDDDSGTFLAEKWHQSLATGNEDNTGSSDDESSRSVSPETSSFPLDDDGNNEDTFYQETLDSIRSGIIEKVNTENLILMINASKHAYNIPINDVPLNIMRAILEGPAASHTKEPGKQSFVDYVIKGIQFCRNLLLHYVKEKPSLQVSVLNAMADFSMKDSAASSVFAKAVLELYNIDVVEENAIMSWYEQFKSSQNNKEHQNLVKQIGPVIEWLQTAEEESDEEEED